MAEMVGSALVQEAVSRVSSYVFSRREEKAPPDQGHSAERLEMALAELEFALERSAKLPITDVSLLRRRKVFKRAYVEVSGLLSRSQQAPEGQETGHHGVTPYSNPSIFPDRTAREKIIASISSSLHGLKNNDGGLLSCADVRRFECLADRAGKFVRDVESGCSLRHHIFCSPLTRQLLEVEGKTLEHEAVQGSQLHRFFIWPACDEDRGVEAVLSYLYEDHETPEKSFQLVLALRLSESTDIAGTAVEFVRSLTSQFKLVAEPATGELALLLHSSSSLQDISDSYAPPWVGIHEDYRQDTQLCRPHPICCKPNGHGQSYNPFPERVVFTSFRCCIPTPECSLQSSNDETVVKTLEVAAGFAPHGQWEGLQETCAIERIDGREERRNGSVQEMGQTVISKAIDCFALQPELRNYTMLWQSAHGISYFRVLKSSAEMGSVTGPNSSSNDRRAAKRKQR